MVSLSPIGGQHPPHDFVYEKHEPLTRCAHVALARLKALALDPHDWITHKKLLRHFQARFRHITENPPLSTEALDNLQAVVNECFENADLSRSDACTLIHLQWDIIHSQQACRQRDRENLPPLLQKLATYAPYFRSLGSMGAYLQDFCQKLKREDQQFRQTFSEFTPHLALAAKTAQRVFDLHPGLSTTPFQEGVNFVCLILAVKALEEFDIWNRDLLNALPRPLPEGLDCPFIGEIEWAVLQSIDFNLELSTG